MLEIGPFEVHTQKTSEGFAVVFKGAEMFLFTYLGLCLLTGSIGIILVHAVLQRPLVLSFDMLLRQ